MGIIPARTAKQASGAQLRHIYQHGKPTKQMLLRKARALSVTVWKMDDDGNRYETVPRSFNWNHSIEPFDILFYNGTRDNLSTRPSITEQQCVAAMRMGYRV